MQAIHSMFVGQDDPSSTLPRIHDGVDSHWYRVGAAYGEVGVRVSHCNS